jgi:hypothetical protein
LGRKEDKGPDILSFESIYKLVNSLIDLKYDDNPEQGIYNITVNIYCI